MHKILCLAFLLVASPALAEGPPPEIGPYIHATKPYGTGTVTFTFFTVYDAALWTDAKPFTMDKPFALTLHYKHNFSASALVDKTIELMKEEDNVSDAKLRQYSGELMKLWPSVKAGDTITAICIPGKKTIFYYNGGLRGSVEDAAFNKPFFDIWLSEKTTEPAARKTLLAGTP
jgi:hypothetical protein